MADNELLNGLGDEVIDPEYEIEDPVYTLIALHKKSKPSEKVAVEIDKYNDYKKSYIVDGVALYNENLGLGIKIALEEGTKNFGQGPADIPETDPIRKNYTNPTFTEQDGQWRTNWLLENEHQSCEADDCAIKFCVEYNGGGYWLPCCGELSYIQKSLDEVNEAITLVGGTTISGELYRTSTKFSNDYAWCLNMEDGEFAFWKSKSTMIKTRPITTLNGYEVIIEPKPEPEPVNNEEE